MKKLFGNNKKIHVSKEEELDFDQMEDTYYEEDGEGYYEDEEYVDDNDGYYEEGEYAEDGSEEYYEEGEYAEDSPEEYYEEGEYAEDGSEEYYEEGEYAEDGSEEYYEEGEYAEDGSEEYYEEGQYAENTVADSEEDITGFTAEIVAEEISYEIEGPDDEEEEKEPKKKTGGLFRNLTLLDGIIAGSGAAVIFLGIILIFLFFHAGEQNANSTLLASVGQSIKGIDMIGGKGIQSVTNALIDRLEQEKEEDKEDPDPGYDEQDFSTTYAVSMSLTSVQKDLKIKFTNRETGKLLANVPFRAIITTPDGSTLNWSDEDMDGIIYAKGLEAGSYKVKLESLEDQKYSNYILPSATKTVEVKKKIEYQKVDVKDEIKKENEINASVEDTKKNETVVESVLTDTVEWVASTSTANTYTEILKNSIPDPTTIQLTTALQNVAATSYFDPSGLSLMEGQTATLTVVCKDEEGTFSLSDIQFASSKDSVVKIVSVSGNSVVVQAVTGGDSALISYTATGTVSGNDAASTMQGSCMVTVSRKGSLTLAKSSCTLGLNQTETIQATLPEGYPTAQGIVYTVESDKASVATATIDEKGVVTVTGKGAGEAVIAVSVNVKDGTEATRIRSAITVKVADGRKLTLDQSQATMFITNPAEPLVIKAQIDNLIVKDVPVTAVSSDETVATVTVDKKEVRVTALKEGSAVITVTYKEPTDTTELTATCAVTVKVHPKDDRTTKLLDADKNPVYVLENETYREAVYADYYTAEKFFIMKGVKYTGWQTIDNKVFYYNSKGEYVTGEQVIQGAKYNFASDGSLITGSGVLGIDVSKWNGNIDWKAVKNSGVSYVIIRCGYRGSSQGMLIEDPKFAKNIQGATDAGLKVGVYFFSQAIDEIEAVYEASFVLEKIKGYKISYPIFLDVEPSGGRGDKIDKATRTAVCKAFCKTIQNAGYTAGVYANRNWLEEMLDPSQLGEYKIWLAQYAKEPTYKGRYDMWQYKSTGTIAGISGNVDMNISYLGY
ncbi:MAG: GH25 family lysozyme [Acetatifactor sp.]